MRPRFSLVFILCGVSLGLLACNAGRRSTAGADGRDAASAIDARSDLGDEIPTDASELLRAGADPINTPRRGARMCARPRRWTAAGR